MKPEMCVLTGKIGLRTEREIELTEEIGSDKDVGFSRLKVPEDYN